MASALTTCLLGRHRVMRLTTVTPDTPQRTQQLWQNPLPASVLTVRDLGLTGLLETPSKAYFWLRKFAQVSAPKKIAGMLKNMSPIFTASVLPGREGNANAIRNGSALTCGTLPPLMEQTTIIPAHSLILFMKPTPNQPNPKHYLLLNFHKPRPPAGLLSELRGAGFKV